MGGIDQAVHRLSKMWPRFRYWADRVIDGASSAQVYSVNVASSEKSKYGIKPGYIERELPEYFEDVPDGITYQPDVYEFAGTLANLIGARYLVDLGCGSAAKLIDACLRYSLLPVGLDYGRNLSDCRRSHPAYRWVDVDFENPQLDLLSQEVLEQSVIICSDLIEHLKEPANLVALLRHWLCFARLGVLSTPERDARWGIEHNGPPPNPHHVREWNAKELHKYLQEGGLTVNFIGLTRTKHTSYAMWTMLVLLGVTGTDPAHSSSEGHRS